MSNERIPELEQPYKSVGGDREVLRQLRGIPTILTPGIHFILPTTHCASRGMSICYVCKKIILNTFRIFGHFCLQVLSDVISIMSYEVKPELAAQPHPQSGQPLRWMPKVCLTSPATCAMVPIGMCGVIKVQNKMLLVLQVWSLIQCLRLT